MIKKNVYCVLPNVRFLTTNLQHAPTISCVSLWVTFTSLRLALASRKLFPSVVAVCLRKRLRNCSLYQSGNWLAVPRRIRIWHQVGVLISAPCGWVLVRGTLYDYLCRSQSPRRTTLSLCQKISVKADIDRIKDTAVLSALTNSSAACYSFPRLSSRALHTTIGRQTQTAWQCALCLEPRHRT